MSNEENEKQKLSYLTTMVILVFKKDINKKFELSLNVLKDKSIQNIFFFIFNNNSLDFMFMYQLSMLFKVTKNY